VVEVELDQYVFSAKEAHSDIVEDSYPLGFAGVVQKPISDKAHPS
jgi:hypothetical protein